MAVGSRQRSALSRDAALPSGHGHNSIERAVWLEGRAKLEVGCMRGLAGMASGWIAFAGLALAGLASAAPAGTAFGSAVEPFIEYVSGTEPTIPAKEKDADSTIKQAEASAEQVEHDLNRLSTFSEEVRKSLDEADKVKLDVQHALGYFREQSSLAQDERDAIKTKVVRLEEEVVSLQKQIQALEDEKQACVADKKVLSEANAKVQAQIDSVFQFGSAVRQGLVFRGLSVPSAANATE